MKVKMIRLISVFFDRFPWLRSVKDKWLLSYYQFLYAMRKKKEGDRPDYISVPVGSIHYALSEKLDVENNLGVVKTGGWDQGLRSFDKMDVYEAIKSRITCGLEWSESRYYARVLAEIESGEVKWGCKNKKDLDDRFSGLDALIVDIRERGILSASSRGDKNRSISFYDDIILCIDRNGLLVLHDGRHRLAIAKVLGLGKVEVRVSVRHKQWMIFSDEVNAYAAFNKKLYAPVLHPDLKHIESFHGHERFEQMKNNLPVKAGKLLDIGSHWGYFCHQFEELGFNCVAMEPDQKNLYFLNKLRVACAKEFDVAPTGLFDYSGPMSFGVVLALYVFHHFLKLEEDYLELKKFLMRLDSKHMFFSTHATSEPQMQGAFSNMEPETFSDFVIENSSFKTKICLWTGETGRKLYLLSQ